MNTQFYVDPLVANTADFRKGLAPHTVNVKGPFNEDMAEKFAKEMGEAVATGQKVVPVVIDSYGGQVYSLMHMLDTLKACPVPVATIVKGKAMSCGQIFAAAGTRGYRYVGPDSTTLLHEMSVGDWNKITEFQAT